MLSRTYASLKLGRYVVELEPDETVNAVKVTFHLANISSLLQQVSGLT